MYATRSERHLDKWFNFIYIPGALFLMGFTLTQVKFYDYLFQGNMPEMVAYALLMVIAMNFVLGTYAVMNGCQLIIYHLTNKKMKETRQNRKVYYLMSYTAYNFFQMALIFVMNEDINLVKGIMYVEGFALVFGLVLFAILCLPNSTHDNEEKQEEVNTTEPSPSMGIFVSKETEDEIVEFDLVKEKIIRLEQQMSDLTTKEVEEITTSIEDIKGLFYAYESVPASQKDQARCYLISAFLHVEKELEVILDRVEKKHLHRIERKVNRMINR